MYIHTYIHSFARYLAPLVYRAPDAPLRLFIPGQMQRRFMYLLLEKSDIASRENMLRGKRSAFPIFQKGRKPKFYEIRRYAIAGMERSKRTDILKYPPSNVYLCCV